MGVQAIDQKKLPSVFGKTNVFYRSRSLTSSNKTHWTFPIPRGKYVDLLPALPLNNCILSHGKTPLNINQTCYQVKK